MIEPKKLQQWDQALSQGTDEALDFLQEEFRSSGDYYRLFDALKMKVRKSIGLKLLHAQDDPPLDKATEEKLENGVLDACRQIATLYLSEGNLNDGWIYLQPLSDEPFAKDLIEKVEVTDENFGALIEIAFSNGVSPLYGYRLLLDKSGTCNGITAFDVQAMQFDRETVAGLASILLNHFCDEMRANVIEHVRKVKGSVDESLSLDGFLQKHDWLVREGGHHADATHLASVIRIARQTTTEEDLRLAHSLAVYGCRLSEDFQFASDPPFEQIYEDHKIWYQALLGSEVDAAIRRFETKAEQSKGQNHETAVVEALVDLQIRTGNRDAAVDSMAQRFLSQVGSNELPTVAFEVARSASQFEKLATAFREGDNFAGYAFSILCRDEKQE